MDEVKRLKNILYNINQEGVKYLKSKKVNKEKINKVLKEVNDAIRGASKIYKTINLLPPMEAERMKQRIEQLLLNSYDMVRTRYLKRFYFFLKELYLITRAYWILGVLYRKY